MNKPIYGTVKPPESLEPAIDSLSGKGRAWLVSHCEGRRITPSDVAKAADYERGELNEQS